MTLQARPREVRMKTSSSLRTLTLIPAPVPAVAIPSAMKWWVAFAVSAGLTFAFACRADVPSAGNSTVPAAITLVGSAGGQADAAGGAFNVVVRTLSNNPKNGASVVI